MASQGTQSGKHERAEEPEEEKRARIARALAENMERRSRSSVKLAASTHNAETLESAHRAAQEAGAAYFRLRWPTVPLTSVGETFDQVFQARESLRKKVSSARRAGKHEKLPGLMEALDEAERNFVAARLDPANEEAVARYREYNAKKSYWPKGKTQSSRKRLHDSDTPAQAPPAKRSKHQASAGDASSTLQASVIASSSYKLGRPGSSSNGFRVASPPADPTGPHWTWSCRDDGCRDAELAPLLRAESRLHGT